MSNFTKRSNRTWRFIYRCIIQWTSARDFRRVCLSLKLDSKLKTYPRKLIRVQYKNDKQGKIIRDNCYTFSLSTTFHSYPWNRLIYKKGKKFYTRMKTCVLYNNYQKHYF